MIAWLLILTSLTAAMGVMAGLFIANAPRAATPGTWRYVLAILFPTFLGAVMAVSAEFPAFLIGGLAGSFIIWMSLTKAVQSRPYTKPSQRDKDANDNDG